MKKLIMQAAIIANMALICFVLLNLVAIPIIRNFYFNPKFREASFDRFLVEPARNLELISQVRPGESPEDIGAKKLGAANRLHTVLEYTTPAIRSEFINVGAEGIRYHQPDVTDAEVLVSLKQPGATWILGGSTSFGSGVGDQETWPFYYQQLAGQTFNFSVPGYNQDDEIRKLIYLLKKGYRPARVIFFDGLNDIHYNCANNYNYADQFSRYGKMPYTNSFSHDWLYNSDSSRTLLANLPLTILAGHIGGRFNYSMETLATNKDANIDAFDHGEAMYINERYLAFYEHHTEAVNRKIIQFYRANVAFVQQLGQAFGFKTFFFYQPNGMTYDNNVFFKEQWQAYTESSLYYAFATVGKVVRTAIRDGEFGMVDLSDCLEGMDKPRYIDPAHYSRFANQVIAEAVYRHTHSLALK